MANLVAMPVSRETMEKHENRHVRQVEHAAKQWEARQPNVSNNSNRRSWLERQRNANYRINTTESKRKLSQYRNPCASRARLKKTNEDLYQLCLQVRKTEMSLRHNIPEIMSREATQT